MSIQKYKTPIMLRNTNINLDCVFELGEGAFCTINSTTAPGLFSCKYQRAFLIFPKGRVFYLGEGLFCVYSSILAPVFVMFL